MTNKPAKTSCEIKEIPTGRKDIEASGCSGYGINAAEHGLEFNYLGNIIKADIECVGHRYDMYELNEKHYHVGCSGEEIYQKAIIRFSVKKGAEKIWYFVWVNVPKPKQDNTEDMKEEHIYIDIPDFREIDFHGRDYFIEQLTDAVRKIGYYLKEIHPENSNLKLHIYDSESANDHAIKKGKKQPF